MQVWVVVVAVVVVVVVVLGCGDVGVAGGLSERVWETTDMYWIGWRSLLLLLLLLLSLFLLLSSLEPMLSDTVTVFTVLAWSPGETAGRVVRAVASLRLLASSRLWLVLLFINCLPSC